MNKSDLIKSMSEKGDITRADAEKALYAFVESIEEALVNGDKVQLIGFGSFEVRERAERKGRNPQTKKEITIKASKAPVFKVGKALKDMVNSD
jgi:DNA-binding protein HU-beta